ncbi:MAG: GTP-binding protein [Dehalococcoidales bacterium]|nr:GTP-binding protein [Dehalococcoidales bacterium]
MTDKTILKQIDSDISLEQMNIVVVGHVDHGKSTLIGRLMADTNSLPTGKLEQVKATCARNAKPFEYAFLLDALKDEQAQGITIDTARCFFNSSKRRYVIIDAPGHIEFLKNMITGAARAEAAFIVIDAAEGIQENSKRHGYMVSMLGIGQVCVLVNKMDLKQYDEKVFNSIRAEYTEFLTRLNVYPTSFIPISAKEGINVTTLSSKIPWYKGLTVLGQMDAFNKIDARSNVAFRFPVQDIYKFTEEGDDRRIFAGTVETGKINVGDDVVFYPSGKRSIIKSIESFNAPISHSAHDGQAIGFTLKTQVYVRPGEMMAKVSESPPCVATRFRVNLFWMGRAPMIPEKKYKLKLGAASTTSRLIRVINVLDASELTSEQNKQQVDRHDVAECILETTKPVAFDIVGDNPHTSRLVIIDNYDIAGAGIILERIVGEESTLKNHVQKREFEWKRSDVAQEQRIAAYGHGSKFVVFTGAENDSTKEVLATGLELRLLSHGFKVYFLPTANLIKGLDADLTNQTEIREEHIRRLGELARILTDSGQIFITSISNVDGHDLRTLELLNKPNEIVVINVGENRFDDYDVNLSLDDSDGIEEGITKVCNLLIEKKVIFDYSI